MRKKKSPVPVAAGLLAAAVLVGIGGFALNRYAPTVNIWIKWNITV